MAGRPRPIVKTFTVWLSNWFTGSSNSFSKLLSYSRQISSCQPNGSSSFVDHNQYSKWNGLHKPGENYKAKNYILTGNTYKLLNEHLKITSGLVRTRFPPEPNGLLHIGHCKAIDLSFGYAELCHGICFLRFDDTNPVTVDEVYVESILDIINWLGFKPYKVTYASDYFEELYALAKKLIKKDLAFVCHVPSNFDNYSKHLSPWRDRPTPESLQAYEDMKNGRYKEGEATLRIKFKTEQQTIDPVIYRIKYQSHHRTASKWCIYPTYDYAHCLCDSLEHITHSFCSTEFTLRRATYYWICTALDVYCPVQIEFGRLNFLYTVTSKRKIIQLIDKGFVKGWDDPRLFTLAALRRRGVPVESITAFCEKLGFNQKNIYVDPEHLFFLVRDALNKTATRVMGVLNPIKVVITNFPYDSPLPIKVNNVPKDESKGFHTITFDKEIWIELDDFKEYDQKDYRRLTPNQSVGLKHTGLVIYFQELVKTSEGKIDFLKVTCQPKNRVSKPKAFIHWVSHPVLAELRIYNYLFLKERPNDSESDPDAFLHNVNPKSLEVIPALMDRSLFSWKVYDRFQFERTGYFALDPDSSTVKLVFNRIVDLRQDKGFKNIV